MLLYVARGVICHSAMLSSSQPQTVPGSPDPRASRLTNHLAGVPIIERVDWTGVFVIAFAAGVIGSPWLRAWLFKQYKAGKITGRRAGWTYAAAAGAPYVVLFTYMGIRDPGSIWMSLLVGLLIFGVMIVPWIATFRYPEDKRRQHR